MLEVLQAGMLSTPQDLGRPGYRSSGIGPAGAADPVALRLANALVGNEANACALEMTLQGPVLQAQADCWLALAGAPLPSARIDDQPVPMGSPRRLRKGSTLHCGRMSSGCRSYLAFAGGLLVPPWLGSRSRDVNAGLGPAPLRKGDILCVGPSRQPLADDYRWAADLSTWHQDDSTPIMRILPGLHSPHLIPESAQALHEAEFCIDNDSNRVACRLQGPRLRLRHPVEIITAGTVAGSMQLPPGGQPIVFGCEHPVSGGYPRIAQLIAADQPRLAQLRPGNRLRFKPVDLPTALRLWDEQEQSIRGMLAQIRRRLEQA